MLSRLLILTYYGMVSENPDSSTNNIIPAEVTSIFGLNGINLRKLLSTQIDINPATPESKFRRYYEDILNPNGEELLSFQSKYRKAINIESFGDAQQISN